MKTASIVVATICGFTAALRAFAATPNDGSVLPFPTPPSASKAGQTLQQSVHKRRIEPEHLPKDAPNVLIILIDDAGFGVPDTFGGFAHTPTLSRLRDKGISYWRYRLFTEQGSNSEMPARTVA
jgi:arylsulfatase